jgi:hypothetical protein
MPKKITPLSDIEIKKAKPEVKDYKLSDGSGLYLLITTTGGKLWRMDYRLHDKHKTLILKLYPEISLADARQRREDARKLIANGIDPIDLKKSLKEKELAPATIEAVAAQASQTRQPRPDRS